MTQKQIFKLLTEITGQTNVLTIPVIFLKKLNGNYAASLFLSQLIYWSDKTKDKDGWIFKTYEDWEKEIFVKEKKLRMIKKSLEQLGIIETKIKKICGTPTVHYRIKQEALLNFLTSDDIKVEDENKPKTAKEAETEPQNRENENGQNDCSETVKMTETKPSKEAELFSNIDYSIDYNIDYKKIPPKTLGGIKQTEKTKPKKNSLRDREPCNDLEVVEKQYLTLWDNLYSRGLVKTKEPLINWIQVRALLKNLLKKMSLENLNAALKKAAEDSFILENGFNLAMILSANVLNRLLNAYSKHPEQKNKYRKSAYISSDKMQEGDYLE